VSQQVDAADPEPDGDLAGALGILCGAQRPDEERVQRGMRVVLRGQAGHALHHPGRVPQALEVLAQSRERMHDVEVVQAQEVAAPGVEEHQLADGQELERAAEPRARPSRGARDTRDPAGVLRVEGDEPIGLPQGTAPDDDRVGSPERD
jgi:hypothetical protein